MSRPIRAADPVVTCLLATMLLLSIAACGVARGESGTTDQSQAWLLESLSPPQQSVWRDDNTWVLTPVRTYGTMEGPLSFAYIVALAVSDRGVLAVADQQACTITLIQRPQGRYLRRFGSCGEGPGEFRQIRALQFSGYSLVVYDQARQQMLLLNADGIERARIHLALPGVDAVRSFARLDDSTVLVATERVVAYRDVSGSTRRLPLVGLLAWPSGQLRSWVASDPPIATVGPQRTLRRMESCLTRIGNQPVAVIKNDWVLEGAGLGVRSGAEVFHFLSTIRGLEPEHRSDGSWAPSTMVTDAVWCGASGAIFKITEPQAPHIGVPPRPKRTFLEFRGYDGSILMRRTVRDSSSMLHTAFGTMRADTLLVASNLAGPWPMVGEFVLRRSGH